ncbi:MAG: hypothetical protein UV82_C0001G0029 [Candidatus Magasanikbacteria bacterium GW2011_GWD2_43_18]|nr:MAG: hypothetical protein UV18_C0001G0052 [Candidatus Magasanikbacteria bacterium GW2011_GWC2_42_27]KKT05240.1 MAG: hypothetical protein UV82_C0001G0029 [Candidatus Magasanikbacteria bacterium GW2011_GWD2_43_18]KKT26138.1 MAG: hypothetical protein UW10_C0001G0052 [Candidatus Magasanikbacteria bacterium GW2011_GWA2_43_9]HBB37577.1 hypothetical protein [Candidatus Magasanikbacteria bacterium]HCC13575.1 hypothetical protein [Candidatus Magasanikbacteria bacterium]
MTDVINITKKAFTWSVVVMTIAWSIGLSALAAPLAANAAECPTLEAGDLFKVKGNSAVYLLDSDMKRMYFPTSDLYHTWYSDFSGVVEIDSTCVSAYPNAVNPSGVDYRPGSRLVKVVISPEVYAVGPGNMRHLIGSEDEAKSLYGDNWGTLVRDVHDFHWPNYTTGAEVSGVHNGMLIKNNGSGVWYVKDGMRHSVEGSLSSFLAGDVRTVSTALFDAVEASATPVTAASIIADPSQGGGSGTPGTPVVTGSLQASLAATSPSTVAAQGSIFNDVLHVRLTAGNEPVSVTGLTVQKSGLVANTGFSGVSVWVGSDRHGAVVSSLDDDGMAEIGFGSNPIVVPANSSVTASLQVNVAAGASAASFTFRATAVDTTGNVSVSGLPVVGSQATVTPGTLASYTVTTTAVSGYDNETAAASSANEGQLEIGDTQKEVFKFTLAESGNEALNVQSVTFFVQGSINEDTSLKNWTIYGPTGQVLGTKEWASGDRYVTVPMNYTLDKGDSDNFTVKVDVVDGSNDYFALYIQNDYDVKAKGSSSGYFVAPTSFASGGYASATGWFKMKQGTLSVQKSSASPSASIAAGGSDTVLAEYTLKAVGEAVEIRKMALEIEAYDGAGDPDLTGNVKVVDVATGKTYLSTAYTNVVNTTSTADSSFASGTQLDLSTYLTIKSGESKTIRVTANVADGATAVDTYMVKVGKFYLKRLSSLDYQTKPNSTTAYPANTVTVNPASLTLAKNTSVGNKTVAIGAQDVVIGSFKLQAGSSEGVNVSSIVLSLPLSTGARDVENVGLWIGSTQLGTETVSPSASTTFSISKALAVNEVVTIDVKADVQSDAADGTAFTPSVESITATGVTTGQNAAGSVVATDLQAITYGSEKLIVTNDSSVESKILTPSATKQLVAKYKFEAQNSDINLTKLTFSLRNHDNASKASSSNYGDFELRNAAGAVLATAPVVDNGTDALVTFTGFSTTIASGATEKLSLYAMVNNSGTMVPANVARAALYSDGNTYLEAYGGQGLLAATKIGTSTVVAAGLLNEAASNQMLFHNTAPVIALASGAPSGSATPDTETTVFKYTVTNPGARDMRISTTSVYLSVSGLAGEGYVYDFKLYDGSTLLANTSTIASPYMADVLSTTTPSLTIAFGPVNDTSSRLANFVLSAGETKTFTVTANTSNIRTGLSSGNNALLSAKLDGATGYESADDDYEDYWADGVMTYFYTPVNGSENSTAYTASDSYDVNGSALSF